VFTTGFNKTTITYPIMMIAATRSAFVIHEVIFRLTANRKNKLQIKASLDKNRSQRMKTGLVGGQFIEISGQDINVD
jgi:hypothetical protein